MPAIGDRGPMPALPLPKAPAKAPPPPPPIRVSAPPSHTDASSGGYDFGRANAYKATPAYRKAVVDTFRAQPVKQQKAIVSGALRNPTQEGKAVLDYLRGADALNPKDNFGKMGAQPFPKQAQAVYNHLSAGNYLLLRDQIAKKYGADVFKGLSGNTLGHLLYSSSTPQDQAFLDKYSARSGQKLAGEHLANPAGDGRVEAAPKGAFSQSPGAFAIGAISGLVGHDIQPALDQGAAALGTTAKFLTKPAVNIAKDAVNLPAETFATVGTVGGDLASGNFKKVGQDLIAPYEQLALHPLQTIADHPLDSYLTAAGPVHGITRAAAGAVRAAAPESAAGRALNLERPSVALTGKLTHERPQYSPYPLIQAAQKLVERAGNTRTADGKLIPRRENVASKLTALETSRIVGQSERIRRMNRDAAVEARLKAVRRSLPARAAGQVGRALKAGSKQITIPGADHVLALIADGTIRRPDTFHADLAKYVARIASNRGNLLDRTDMLKEHDAQVAQLRKVLNDPKIARNIPALFKAADAYAKDYAGVQAQARNLGHFGNATKADLQRRELMHYAVSHLGASFDEEHGLTVPRVRHGADEPGTPRPLPMSEVVAHMNGPEGLGGRQIAFTSDKARPGSAFYVSSERRPMPEVARNTLFAYTHGLTDTGHEALMRQHVRMQGIVDAHKAQNRLLDQVAVSKPDGTYWSSYKGAQQDAQRTGGDLVPIRLSEPFHGQSALEHALEGVNPATLEEEAQLRGLDLSSRLQDSGPAKYALIHKTVLQRLQEHRSLINPNIALRAFGSANTQFRKVALSTSAKHIPGVASEQLIRDISSGVGLSSWITGHRLLNAADRINPEEGRNLRTSLTGGTVSGSTQLATRHFVSERYRGTSLYPFAKNFERLATAPGIRPLRATWNAWTTFAINGTKHVLEEQHQIADVGKIALREFGSQHGPFFKALRLQGQMADDAARGLFDPKKFRQFRTAQERIRGRWTDLTPHGQMALMMSPFGMWWMNSVKFLGRMPVDQPVKTGVLAAATVGTEKSRQQHGLDMFSAGRVPDYMQGGIPLGGGKVLAQNYYSPFGVANDPAQTVSSLVQPWLIPPVLAGMGVDWKGKPINSPGNPHGDKPSNFGQRAAVILNSLFANFIPLYSKAQTVAQGGASAYDTSTLWNQQTKTPPGSFSQGLKKAVTPYRMYTDHSSGGGNGYLLGGSSSGGGGGGGYLIGGQSSSGSGGYLLP